jgi:transposase
MHLDSSLAAAAAFPRPEKLTAFAAHLPQEWIEKALQATGTATLRKRRLPAEQVVWLVLGMALFRDRSIVEVVDKLVAQTFAHAAEKTTFDHYLAVVDYQEASQIHLEKEIAAIASQPEYAETVAKLSSLRGIAVLSAMVLITEIQDFRRFTRPRELMAYLGLVPSEHSSGATERRGGITKTGNSHARRILVEAAWHYRHPPVARNRVHHAMKGESPARIAFARKAQARLHGRYVRLLGRGKSRQAAAVAVARELCGFVWAAALQA